MEQRRTQEGPGLGSLNLWILDEVALMGCVVEHQPLLGACHVADDAGANRRTLVQTTWWMNGDRGRADMPLGGNFPGVAFRQNQGPMLCPGILDHDREHRGQQPIQGDLAGDRLRGLQRRVQIELPPATPRRCLRGD